MRDRTGCRSRPCRSWPPYQFSCECVCACARALVRALDARAVGLFGVDERGVVDRGRAGSLARVGMGAIARGLVGARGLLSADRLHGHLLLAASEGLAVG